MPGSSHRNAQAKSVESHTALSVLNDIIGPLNISDDGFSGPPHCPVYSVSVVVDRRKFTASGDSKKDAKQKLAMGVLHNKFPGYIERFNLKWNSSNNNKEKRQSCNRDLSALAVLNEIEKNVHFEVNYVSGPPHKPVFKAVAKVRGQTFSGCGNSIQLAKQTTAQKVVNKLIGTDEPKRKNQNTTPSTTSKSSNTSSPKLSEWNRKLIMTALKGEMSILEVLKMLNPSPNFTIEETPKESPYNFVSYLQVEDKVFKGFGVNKKAATVASTKAYLNYLIDNYCGLQDVNFKKNLSSPTELTITHPTIADKLADKVLSKYNELTKSLKDYSKRIVLAGICMTTNFSDDNFEVISLATGTKTISGSNLSLTGSVVNDSHAEVLARRGFLRFLYAQLIMVSDGRTGTNYIFNKKSGGGFVLKPGVRFHFYLSSAPCGDARLFSFNDNLEGADISYSNRSRGLLRVKLEDGMGAIKIEPNKIQSWDGIMMGDRLLTMSCSDKFLKWNVLGLQGTLLMHFIDKPLYLDNLVISRLFSKPHLERALRGRIYHPSRTAFCDLLVGYSLKELRINNTSSEEPRPTMKPPNHAINWNIADNIVEVLNMTTGTTVEKKMSVLSKASFADLFMRLLRKRNSSLSGIALDQFETYGEAKLEAKVHEEAKRIFYGLFPKAGLSTWIKKPQDQNDFIIN